MMDKETYNFEFVVTTSVEATDLSEAVKIFHETYPDVKPNFINHIVRERDEQYMADAFSKETRERIYYEPGCPYGYTDCILDPMKDVAKACAHQSEMTADKYVECRIPGPFDEEGCDCYDDEDK